MTDQTYRVVLKGIKEGEDFVVTQGRIAKLFKLDEAEVENWLTGPPKTVKSKVDIDTAKKYKSAIERAGACCQIIRNPDQEDIAVQAELEEDRAENITKAVARQRDRHEEAPIRRSDEKFCSACGKVIHSSATHCTQCGASQVAQQAQVPMAKPANSKATDQRFCSACAAVMHISATQCPSCGAKQSGNLAISSKSKTTAGVLALLIGGLGAHKFYLGRIGMGLIYLCLFWTGLPALVGFFEGIYYLVMDENKFNIRVAAGTI
jgi:TM2 domain-containing membrane protein YozV/RNA polymerase subunit RPABC4/transcription elongation factor Spt4